MAKTCITISDEDFREIREFKKMPPKKEWLCAKLN